MPWIALAAPPSVPTTIDVEVTAISSRPVERDVSVDVPDGMRVVAMEVESGGVRTRAQLLAATDASDRFRTIVQMQRDPALIEQDDDGRVALHVFPVTRDRPAHVTLTLAHAPVTRGLDTTTSLFAETPPPAHEHGPVVIIDRIAEPARTCWLGTHEVRDVVRLHEPQLRHCYDVSLQRHPMLAGTAELHFLIGVDGAVASASVDGTLPSADVDACLAHEVATWQFPAGDGPIAVNYPLTFQPPP